MAYVGTNMKKLYAPWRSKYVTSVLQKIKGEPECVFCTHYADTNDADNFILKRGEHAGIVMNIYPYSSGHIMVIPYQHTGELTELSAQARAECMELVNLSCNVLKKVIGPEGFNVGVNLGKAAGAGIPRHLHIHIVPRWMGDINFMPVIGEVKIISTDINQLYGQLLEAFRKHN